jgi:hypothetical protein
MESIDDNRGPPVTGRGPTRGGVSVFTDQTACPFRGFARHRLGARAIEDPVPGLGARQRGELVHRTLQEFWSSVPSHEALLGLSDSVLRARALTAVDHAIGSMRGRVDAGRRFWDLEHERLVDLLLESLRMERDRPPFDVIATERSQVLHCGELELEARIDRIDRLEDGGEVMIDYKTGNAARGDWSTPRPDGPQLPLYALNRAGAAVVGIAYARVRKGDCAYIDEPEGILSGPGADDGSDGAWRERLSRWQQEMDRIAEEVHAGYAVVDPKRGPATCRRCRLQVLCRIHEVTDGLARPGENGD